MERRGTTRIGSAFVATILTIASLLAAGLWSTPVTAESVVTHAAAVTAPDDTVPDAPPLTVSEFFPEENNLSDCLGLVERPGCGSEARGGWGQTAVFLALAGGLGIIFWRISRGVRANRAATESPDTR